VETALQERHPELLVVATQVKRIPTLDFTYLVQGLHIDRGEPFVGIGVEPVY